MNLFAVIFEDSMPSDILDIAETQPMRGGFQLSDQMIVVQSYAENPKVISDILGMTGPEESPKIGVVFKLNGSHSGYFHADLWDWLAEARGEVRA